MGAGETLAAVQLRLFVPGLVVQQQGQQLLRRCQGVRDVGHGGIGQAQLLPAAGEVPVDGGRRLLQPLDEVGPIMDEQGPHLGHAQVKVVQGGQQGGVLVPVPQDAGLVLIQSAVFRQGLGVPGAELTDSAVQKPPPGGGPLPDKIQVLRAEQHRVQHPRQLPGVFQPDPVGEELSGAAPGQLGLHGEGAAPAFDDPPDVGGGLVHADHLPVIPGPVGPGGGQIGDGLQ